MQERVREPVCGRACVSLLLTVTNPYRCPTLLARTGTYECGPMRVVACYAFRMKWHG